MLGEILEACQGWDSGHGIQPAYHKHPSEVVSGVPWGPWNGVASCSSMPHGQKPMVTGLEFMIWLLGSGSPEGLSWCCQGLWLLDRDRGSCAAWHRHHFTASILLAVSKRPLCPPRGTGSPRLAGPPCPVFLHHLFACAEPVNHAVGGIEMGWELAVLLGLKTCRAAPRARGPTGAGDMQG